MAKHEGWLQESDGALVAIPDSASNNNSNITITIDRRVYERKHKHSDGKWVFVYQMTEPA